MNDHSKRLICQIIKCIDKYLNGEINAFGLLENISGNVGAMEEKEIIGEIDKIANAIEDALWSYNEDEGIEIIKKHLVRLKEMLEPYV